MTFITVAADTAWSCRFTVIAAAVTCAVGLGVAPDAWAQDSATRQQTSAPAERPATQPSAVYDTAHEGTFSGTVAEVKSGGPGRLGWLMRVHTLGPGHGGTAETQVVLNTNQGEIWVHLGPTTFVKQQRIEIKNGDRIEVLGSRLVGYEPSRILAREVRTADNAWTLRDPAGRPLWSTAETAQKRFWTKNQLIVIGVVAAKVVLLTTVLSH